MAEVSTARAYEAELALDQFCEARGFDWGIKAEVADQACWDAEVRVTTCPNRPHGQPDRSLVTYAVGGGSADEVIERAVSDMIAWLGEIQ